MLLALSIRDIVLIDRLDLSFHSGLCVMTGETGAGKSILLDALGLALGERGDTGLIRQGCKQALVSAEFSVSGAVIPAMIEEHALPEDDTIVLRRALSADGRSRAFINDQPVSAGLLRSFGDQLAEIQGQREGAGLRRASTHRTLVDAFGGGTADALAKVSQSYYARQTADEDLRSAEAEAEKARAEEEYLRFAVDELEALAPEEGEEAELAQRRDLLRHGEQLKDALLEAETAINDNGSVESRLHLAVRHVGRAAQLASGHLDGVLAALEGASAEAADAAALLEAAIRDSDPDPQELNRVEERLFALRALARKHQTTVDDLPRIWRDVAGKLQGIDEGGARLRELEAAALTARSAYDSAANSLTKSRQRAAKKLDKAVARELAPLKLGKARLRTRVDSEGAGGPDGRDTVQFEAATNEGQDFAPLARIASGGELSRFLLALRVVLAGTGAGKTLIFDEADSGVGGATADAVGERLSQLASSGQVLAVTHSPQVAARGDHHWRIAKSDSSNGKRGVLASAEELSEEGRREEVARMLAGAEITEEARAAARRLIEQREELPA